MWSVESLHKPYPRAYQKCRFSKEIVTRVTMWMNLEDILLNEISQSLKSKYCMIPAMWGSQCRSIHRDKVVLIDRG
jgi:hypothetical protein